MSEAKRAILIPALQISCVLGHSFHTWSDNLRAQFQPSLTACTELKCQPGVKAWCLFWACIQPWAHIWSSRFPGFVGSFSRSFSLMCLLLQPVPPQAFWSVCCLSVTPCPKWLLLPYSFLNIFNQHHLGGHHNLRKFWRQAPALIA